MKTTYVCCYNNEQLLNEMLLHSISKHENEEKREILLIEKTKI